LSCKSLNVISESPVPSHIAIRQHVLTARDKPTELVSVSRLVRCVWFYGELICGRCWSITLVTVLWKHVVISWQLDIVYSGIKYGFCMAWAKKALLFESWLCVTTVISRTRFHFTLIPADMMTTRWSVRPTLSSTTGRSYQSYRFVYILSRIADCWVGAFTACFGGWKWVLWVDWSAGTLTGIQLVKSIHHVSPEFFSSIRSFIRYCGPGSSLLWDLMLVHCASPGEQGTWLVYASVCVKCRVKGGLSRSEQLVGCFYNALPLGMAYCLAKPELSLGHMGRCSFPALVDDKIKGTTG